MSFSYDRLSVMGLARLARLAYCFAAILSYRIAALWKYSKFLD
jgi:hypothetical protein